MHLLRRSLLDPSEFVPDSPNESLLIPPRPSPTLSTDVRIFGFQVGEIVTFCLLGFAVLLTCAVVAYYKCLAPSLEARTRVVFNPKENRRISRYGKELFGRFVKHKNSNPSY